MNSNKLLEYHKNIDDYILVEVYCYQIFIKPFNDKLTRINLKERIKLTTLILISGLMSITYLIVRKLTKR